MIKKLITSGIFIINHYNLDYPHMSYLKKLMYTAILVYFFILNSLSPSPWLGCTWYPLLKKLNQMCVNTTDSKLRKMTGRWVQSVINWLCQSFFKQIFKMCWLIAGKNWTIVMTLLWLWVHWHNSKIIFCQLIEGGSSSMLTNEPISQSFSQSWASWTRQQPGSNPALEGNWRRGRHSVRLSKRAEGCVSKGLAEAHETPTRSKGVGCVGGHSGGRMSGRKTERRTETERIVDKGMWFWNDWEWNHLCWQSHGNCVSVWIGVRESGSEGDSVCVCVCVCVCVWVSERERGCVSLHVYQHSEAPTWEVSPEGCCLFPICQTLYRKYSKHIQTDT